MRANIIHMDLNYCGGAEQVSLVTIQALLDMDIDVDLTVARIPDILRLTNAFGRERVDKVFSQIRRINALGSLAANDNAARDYDITINTHGDLLPYYLPSFSKSNAITYCHYPVATEFILQHNRVYPRLLADLGLLRSISYSDANADIWNKLLSMYITMLKNSLIITNSSFSKKAIMKVLSSQISSETRTPIIIPPPVYIEEYRTTAFSSSERDDSILVLSRIHPTKKLEYAILLASMLKQERIGSGMMIVGNLLESDHFSRDYYDHIMHMIDAHNLSDYVKLEVNVPIQRLKSLMKKSRVYFHSMPGEPFGISTVEAMSAGLVPVVPNVGGHTDFVPKQYRFGSLQEAVRIISCVLHASNEERTRIINSVIKFSVSNFVRQFQAVIKEMIKETEVGTSSPRISGARGRSVAA